MNILELPGSSHVGAGMSCSSLWRKLETGTIRDNCVGRFRHFLALGGAASLKEETCEMRKIFCSVYGQRGKMSEKARKTIFKIKYFWPLYRMKHNK